MRRISRLGGSLERAKLNAALQLTARGVPVLYYGEEVGMEQCRLPVEASLDLGAGRLYRPVPEEVPSTFAYWIVCPKFSASQPKIQRFRQWLLSQAHLDSE